MKYLHNFETYDEFNSAYSNTEDLIVTAFTCSADTFVYSGTDEYDSYIWTGNSGTISTDGYPKVGDEVYIWDGTTGKYQFITAISGVPEDPSKYYHEPWTSVVKYDQPTVVNFGTIGGVDLNGATYEGEVEVFLLGLQ